MTRAKLLLTTALSLALMAGGVNSAQAIDSPKDAREAKAKPVIRGGIVFKAYCVVCHGEIGNGVARATKLYGSEKLAIRPLGMHEYEKIVRLGGAGVGRSPYMPPWQEELSEEQISDVLTYLGVVGDQLRRGEVVFKTNCILCHGIKGNGQGRASVLYDPRPSDLTRSDKNDEYKKMIITLGGEAMGRSAVMPPWGLQISEQEIEDVVAYVKTLQAPAEGGK
ncbi:MAG: c-type cytochrome [Pseudomonadota bacterium]